jgi:NitT/TauT family transport system substrate-binding protein
MTKQSYIKNHKGTVESFTAAIYKAQQWVATHSAEEIAKAIQSYFPDTDFEIIKTVVERYKSQGSYATDPILDKEEWNNLQNIMKEAGVLPKEVDHKTIVNTAIAEKVIKK